jgi:hypothetical protein
MIYDWIHAGGEVREKAWADAKKQSADALVEEGMEILDDPAAGLMASTMTQAKERANYRKWLASMRDRDQYGDQPAVAAQVNVNVGDLHLAAVRETGKMSNLPAAENSPDEIQEAEVLAIEPEEVDPIVAELRGDGEA